MSTEDQAARERAEMDAADKQPSSRLRLVDFAPIVPPAIWDGGKRLQEVNARFRVIRSDTCPACAAPDSDTARACTVRGEDFDLDGTPMCRWVRDMGHAEASAARVRERRSRLVGAGFEDEDLIARISEAWTYPEPVKLSPGFRAMRDAVKLFLAEKDRRALTLLGSAGVGKSWASAWIVAETPGAALVRPDLVAPTPEWDALKVRARLATLTVFEDLGLETLGESGWHQRELEALISGRHDKGKQSVITTNLPLEKAEDFAQADSIRRRYGARVLTRLTDASHRCQVIGCGSVNLRGA